MNFHQLQRREKQEFKGVATTTKKILSQDPEAVNSWATAHTRGRIHDLLPAGSVDSGELLEAAARRECEEEIGLTPQIVKRLRGLFPTPGYCDEEMIFFRVADLRSPPHDSPHKPDEDEDIHAQSFTIDEAKAMVERGDIVDLKTAYGLTLI